MRECIDKVYLPQCLANGISYELFWNLNPTKLKPFQEADKIKFERERETTNVTAWINGIYITKAISACFAKNAKYPEKPIDFTGKNQLTLEQKAELWALAMNEEYYRKHPEERPK